LVLDITTEFSFSKILPKIMKFLILFALVAMAAAVPRHPLLPHPLARKTLETRESNGYIVGGVAATEGQVPYIVSLQRTSHFCGGTIISANWILTAAHCVSGTAASSLNIRYNSLTHNAGGSLVKAQAIFVHEGYDSWTIDNDIAIIQLTAPLTLGQPNAAAVPLPAQGSDVVAGDVTVSGWGYLTEGGGSLPAQLQVLDVASVDRATCNAAGAYDGEITENMFCAGVLNVGGKDACQGDSGGPVIQNGAVVGAVSWGYGCARPQYPGVYTRVGVYVDWIKSKGFQ